MIKKTIMITSIAVLIAVISVATTMTMIQANPIGDDIIISIEGVPAEPQFDGATVEDGYGPPEYQGDIFTPVPHELTVDVDDGMI